MSSHTRALKRDAVRRFYGDRFLQFGLKAPILPPIHTRSVSIRLSIGRDTPPDSLVYWCMVWGIFGSACFGVVLEGPMGAIVFWTLLGMANALTYQDSSKKVPSPVPTPIATAPRAQAGFVVAIDFPAIAGQGRCRRLRSSVSRARPSGGNN